MTGGRLLLVQLTVKQMQENIESEIDQLPLAAVTRSMLRSVVNDREQLTIQLNGTPSIEFTGNKLKADQKELIRQNSNLKDEITALRAQVTHRLDQQSWASIASPNGANDEPPTPPPAPTPTSTKADRKDPPLCIRIRTAQASDPMDYGGSLTRYLPVEEVKARITGALQKNTPTEGDTASVNEGWLRNLGNQTKLVRPRFDVVVHRTPTHEVDTEDKPQSMKKITEENELAQKGYKVEEIAWLKKREITQIRQDRLPCLPPRHQ
ncbi:conserved hypothetical protein [Histoplasma capsulatum H143]|uniref:Uncharacterized protein n=1 Tax=Ajellomyces capsulatus (strain H143) TaxID=544712 RepID=C6HHZ8_AJECH|nr:conserved hypothetical protein [Histoplasma capsulatum H143]